MINLELTWKIYIDCFIFSLRSRLSQEVQGQDQSETANEERVRVMKSTNPRYMVVLLLYKPMKNMLVPNIYCDLPIGVHNNYVF